MNVDFEWLMIVLEGEGGVMLSYTHKRMQQSFGIYVIIN